MNPDRQCTATNRQGDRCGRAAIEGGTVCNRHGGGSPKVRDAAQRRLALVEARRQVETLGLPIDVDPAEALISEVRRTAGHVAWLAAKVQSLDPEDLVWGRASRTTGKMAQGVADYTEERAMVSVWYDLYVSERKHLTVVSAAALKAGVEERRLKIAEEAGSVIVDVIRRILDDADLDLDPARRALADQITRRHLLAVTASEVTA